MRFHERAIHLGMPVGDPIDFVHAGLADQMLVSRTSDINVGIQNFFVRMVGKGQRLAERIADLALSDKRNIPFDPNPVGRCIINGVLHCPRVDGKVGGRFRTGWPVGGQDDQIRPQQGRQRPDSGKPPS